jgi:hypothetical protein
VSADALKAKIVAAYEQSLAEGTFRITNVASLPPEIEGEGEWLASALLRRRSA